jgi:hypothetical protein
MSGNICVETTNVTNQTVNAQWVWNVTSIILQSKIFESFGTLVE